jgi:DNA-binding CsgD family transcriptional regulator/uncharacterized membrane protein
MDTLMGKGSRVNSLIRFQVGFTGLLFLISFETLLSIQAFPSRDVGAAAIGYISRYLVAFLVFFAVAGFSHRLYPLSERRNLAKLSTAICIIGGVLLIACRLLSLSVAVSLTGVVLVGAGTAFLTLCWLEFYACLDLLRVMINYSAAHIFSSLIIVCYSFLSIAWLKFSLFFTFPLLSYLLYRYSLSQYEKGSAVLGETINLKWSFPLKPVLLIGLFTFTNVLVRSYLPDSTRSFAALGVTISMVPIFLYALLNSERFDIRILYQISFPLVIVGPLCMIVGGNAFGLAGAFGTNAAYTYLSLFVVAVLCNISFRYGVNPLWLFGFAFGAIALGRVFAKLSEIALIGIADQSFVYCAIILALSLMFTALITDRDFSHTWGIIPIGLPEAQDMALDNIVERCAHLARIRGLTRREEEILFYLAQDMSPRIIAAKIYRAESTVKTHVKHIYAKLGVHSKGQLTEIIQRQ